MAGPITKAERANRAVKAATPNTGAFQLPNRLRSRISMGMLSSIPTAYSTKLPRTPVRTAAPARNPMWCRT